jgi:hypothetical protein
MIEFSKSVSQLETGKIIIENLLKDISREQAVWKPDQDSWSILEIINHLIDIETEDFRYDLKLILFEPQKDWPSFDETEWITYRQYNERELAASIKNFVKERDRSLHWLKELRDPDLSAKHVGGGLKNRRMRAGDLLAAWIGHDLFHIRHIALRKWDILNKWSEPYTPEYSGFYV